MTTTSRIQKITVDHPGHLVSKHNRHPSGGPVSDSPTRYYYSVDMWDITDYCGSDAWKLLVALCLEVRPIIAFLLPDEKLEANPLSAFIVVFSP